MTVGELLARISSRELTEWMVYFGLEGPTGDARADWRAGMVASTIANANRDPKKRPQPFRPEEFVPTFGPDGERPEQTVAQQAALAHALQRALGGSWTVGEG